MMIDIDDVDSVGTQIGLSREGTIVGVDPNKGVVKVRLTLSKSDFREQTIDMPIPASWTGPDGEFAGGYPVRGSSVRCVIGQGGVWSISGYVPSTDVFPNENTGGFESFEGDLMGEFSSGRYLIQVRNNIRQWFDPKIGIDIGNPDESIHANPNIGILSNNFQQNMSFTQAHMSVSGQVRRDLISATSTRNVTDSSLFGHDYQSSLTMIGLDPLTKAGDDFVRNPPFVESRNLVYEFERDFGFTNDAEEIGIYDNKVVPKGNGAVKRDDIRADALSLSLDYPNHLIEKIEGTVVDVYGNILDINRNILPSGSVDTLSFKKNEGNQSSTFTKLRELTRRSVAYHWELNARKALQNETPDVLARENYARNRSRFHLDIDKEGQFKLNIPASSEVGNVPLLTRHENYSTIRAAEEGGDPRAFVRNVDNQDIFLESYGKGQVSINANSGEIPKAVDRFENEPIKLGTAFHAIEDDSLVLHKRKNPIFGYQNSILNQIPPLENVVSSEVITHGEGANAGGRSGTIALDGFLNLSIGANTVDRQSLWADLAGGMLLNVGRDLNNMSLGATFDGNVFVQIGGPTVSNDSRFGSVNNANRDGTFDMRVLFGNGMMHVFRIAPEGVAVHSAGGLDISAEGDLRLQSIRGNMYLNAENIYFYSNNGAGGRLVTRVPGRTI